MEVILIISLILLVAGVVLWIHDRITRRHNDGSVTAEEVSAATAQEDEADSEDCCGMHMTCERDSLLTAVSSEAVSYTHLTLPTKA